MVSTIFLKPFVAKNDSVYSVFWPVRSKNTGMYAVFSMLQGDARSSLPLQKTQNQCKLQFTIFWLLARAKKTANIRQKVAEMTSKNNLVIWPSLFSHPGPRKRENTARGS